MLNRLQRNQKEAVRNEFGSHPLLQTIQWTMKQFELQMPSLRLSPEEVFCEAADVLDCVLEHPDQVEELLHGLWDERVADYMDAAPDCTPHDAQMGAACVVYAAMTPLASCRHWDYKYGLLKRMMADVHSHFADWQPFEEQMMQGLERFDDALGHWMNDYLEAETYLSDQIAALFEPKQPPSAKTLPKPKDQDFNPIRTTFSKNHIMDQHIALVLVELKKQKWVAKSVSEDNFLKLFGGGQNGLTYEWCASKGILKELFFQMIQAGYISSPEGVGYLQILQSHFVDPDGNHITNIKGGACGKKALPVIKKCIDLLAIEA